MNVNSRTKQPTTLTPFAFLEFIQTRYTTPTVIVAINARTEIYLAKKICIPRFFKSENLITPPLHTGNNFELKVLPEYWSLVYFSLSQQMSSHDGTRLGETFRFAMLINGKRILFCIFLLFLLLYLASQGHLTVDPNLTSSGDPEKAALYIKQGTLYYGFVIVLFSIYSIFRHRSDLNHISLWERMCKKRPFLECPILKANYSFGGKISWSEIESNSFSLPMTNFGIDGEKFLQITLAALTIIFLMLVQLVK